MIIVWLALCLPLLARPTASLAATSIPLNISATSSASNSVSPNFFGMSFELSFVDQYFGNDTQHIPQPFINYLSMLRSRLGPEFPFRARIGGNSMDTSTYNTSQSSSMLQFRVTDSQINVNNQPVTYGPLLWEVLNQTAQSVQGIRFLLGLSLLNPNDPDVPIVVRDAQTVLGDSLDAFLLGNEPDLYALHNPKPGVANYTLDNYISDFANTAGHFTNSSANNPLLAGPTICCFWDLETILQGGFLSNFSSILKYITVQHYPQNNCFGSHDYDLPYYQSHANTVILASWQQPGIDDGADHIPVLMSEFNSASCGGVPGVSDTFVVGSMWTADYALRLAAVGYTAAYMHTRERDISYNPFDPPAGGVGPWTTNPTFYSYFVVSEALQSQNKSIVVDLNVANSMNDFTSTVAGYAIYDAQSHSLRRVVLFNYANETAVQFALPANVFLEDMAKNLSIKYLSAGGPTEKWNIAWDGQTFEGVGDGVLVPAGNGTQTWARPSQNMNCANGCQVEVPAPGIAVISAGGTSNSGGGGGDNSTVQAPESEHKNGARRKSFSWPITVALASVPTWVLFT